MFKSSERQLSKYLPIVGHIRPDVCLFNDGSVFAMLAVDGLAWETADAQLLVRQHVEYNIALRNMATDTLIISTYQCRGMASPSIYPKRTFPSEFAERLDARYREQLFLNSLYDNRLYVGILIRPARYAGDYVSKKLAKFKKTAGEAHEDRIQRLNDICDLFENKMGRYGPRRIGIRESKNAMFSEIGEALVFAMTGVWRPIGISMSHMGNALFSEKIICGREAIEFRTPGWSVYGAMFGMREYPSSTWPGMFADMSTCNYRCTVFQSFRFLGKAQADSIMNRTQNFMVGAEDKAFEQREQLAQAGNDLMSNKFVMGDHTLSVIVFADSIKHLTNVATQAWNDIASGGLVVAREGAALEAALLSTFPGNDHLRPRPGIISSRNFAAMAPLHNFPAGRAKGHWGRPIAILRTSAGTPYRFHWHVGDVGNTLITGETGSGKSLTAAFLMAMTAGRARIFALDFKRGWEFLIRALGGKYAVLGDGQPHLAPLKALKPTAGNIRFLNDLIRGCVKKEFTDEETRRLSLAIEVVMSLPPEDRSMSEVRAFLGSRPGGAGAALEQWCWGNDLGWVIDAPVNTVDFNNDLNGHDLTAILDNARARGPALLTIFHYMEQQLDGRPLLIPNDEGWKALLDEHCRPMIEKRLRTIRSYGGAFVFLTQGPGEIRKSDIGDVLVEQCPTQISLPVERGTKSSYQEVLKFTDGEWEAFNNLRKGSGMFLLSQGGESTVVSLPLIGMEDEIATLSARESVLKLFDQIKKNQNLTFYPKVLDEVHRLRRIEESQRQEEMA